jgi:hypothetical protein
MVRHLHAISRVASPVALAVLLTLLVPGAASGGTITVYCATGNVVFRNDFGGAFNCPLAGGGNASGSVHAESGANYYYLIVSPLVLTGSNTGTQIASGTYSGFGPLMAEGTLTTSFVGTLGPQSPPNSAGGEWIYFWDYASSFDGGMAVTQQWNGPAAGTPLTVAAGGWARKNGDYFGGGTLTGYAKFSLPVGAGENFTFPGSADFEAAAPEPATFALGALCGIAFLVRRRVRARHANPLGTA